MLEKLTETHNGGERNMNNSKTTDTEIENLIGGAIAMDLPNMVFDIYSKETGLEPVPEEGGHTELFESWFVTEVERAYRRHGIRTVEELKAHFDSRR